MKRIKDHRRKLMLIQKKEEEEKRRIEGAKWRSRDEKVTIYMIIASL
jgi:hypothetical protein